MMWCILSSSIAIWFCFHCRTSAAVSHHHLQNQERKRAEEDDWLCRNLEKSNITIAEGYPSRNAETAGLFRDQFVKMPRFSRWYDMHTDKDSGKSKVCYLSLDPAKLNSTFSSVARHSLPSTPAFWSINQDTLEQKWTNFHVQSGRWSV